MTNPAELYGTYAASVFRFAWYLCGDRALAEDITSETFVRAWTTPSAIDMQTVKGYLFTIARHLHVQLSKERGRVAELDDTVADRAAGPHEQAVARDELDRVRAGLLALPEIDRTVLLMRALDGLPYDEIARATGLTLSAVKVKVHRARARLGHLRGDDYERHT